MTTGEPEIQSFELRWPSAGELKPERVRFAYDRPSDTLFVDFDGAARPAASIALDLGGRDYVYARADVETDEVVGLQIEHYLSHAVKVHPNLVDALDFASFEGIGRDEIARLPRQDGAHGRGQRDRAALVEDLLHLRA